MKIVAWDDRGYERDAQDLGLIMRHYLDAGNQDRVYSDQGDCFDLLNQQFDYDKASSRVLGRDVGKLLSENSRQILERVLSNEVDHGGADKLATAMIRNNDIYYGDLRRRAGNVSGAASGRIRGNELGFRLSVVN